MSTVSMNQARKPWCQAPISTFNNRVTQSGSLANVSAPFQFVDVRDLGTIDFHLTNV